MFMVFCLQILFERVQVYSGKVKRLSHVIRVLEPEREWKRELKSLTMIENRCEMRI